MTKNEFRKLVIISSLITAAAIAIITALCVALFNKYSQPNEENTHISSGTVADVYYASGKKQVVIEMSNGEKLILAYPLSSRGLYSSIGYDLGELNELLKNQNIEYRQMNALPWVVEIYFGDTVINNEKLTSEQITVTRVGIVIVGLIMLALPICGETGYIETKYKLYKTAENKRIRKLKR